MSGTALAVPWPVTSTHAGRMVLMETNYAAPEGGPSGRSVGPARVGTARMLRVALLLAVALQVYVLYLHVPGPESAVAVPHADKLVHGAVFALPAALAVLGSA